MRARRGELVGRARAGLAGVRPRQLERADRELDVWQQPRLGPRRPLQRRPPSRGRLHALGDPVARRDDVPLPDRGRPTRAARDVPGRPRHPRPRHRHRELRERGAQPERRDQGRLPLRRRPLPADRAAGKAPAPERQSERLGAAAATATRCCGFARPRPARATPSRISARPTSEMAVTGSLRSSAP